MNYKEALEKSLVRYFDIQAGGQIGNCNFDFKADFNQRNAQYILVKSAEVYAFQNAEKLYFKDLKVSDDFPEIPELIESLHQSIHELVNINDEHMQTEITLIFAGDFEPSAIQKKAIEKAKYHKSFRFGLKGWTNLKFFYVDRSNKKVYSNWYGRKEKKKFESLFN